MPFRIMKHVKNPLYKNSIFLILSSISTSSSGLFFWLITAKFYSTEDVGLVSAIVSVMGLISMLSILGLDISLARFIPEKENRIEELINTSMTITTIFSITLTFIFILKMPFLLPPLAIILENYIFLLSFLIFTVLAPLVYLQREGVFIGFRKTEYSFLQSIVTTVRIGIVPFLVTLGTLGIYISYGLTTLFAFIFGIIFIRKIQSKYVLSIMVKRDIIKKLFYFSFYNYLARLFEMLPTFVLPIVVTNILGTKQNAYFYIAWQINILVIAIPKYTALSLLAEGAYNRKKLKENVIYAIIFILLGIIIGIVGLLLLGKKLLQIIGEEYARYSFNLLLILIFGAVPFAFNSIYTAIKRIQNDMVSVISIYGCIAFVTLTGSYILIRSEGLIGIGYAWILANIIALIISVYDYLTKSK